MAKRASNSQHSKSRLLWVAPPLTAVSLLAMSTSLAAAVNVRTQPSCTTPACAYAVSGENRTYFGSAENGPGTTFECQTLFDGVATGPFAVAGDPNFVSATQTFGTSGLHSFTLTCRDQANPGDLDSSTTNVWVLSTDTALRQKNSAIDRGLRHTYQQQNVTTGCFDGSGWPVASTGMALLAYENHGHNLAASPEDIYRRSLERGLQCLYDNSTTIAMTEQLCIGDPEADDGDAEHDGKGIRFGGSDQYHGPFAVLAIVNATDAATAGTIFPTTGSGSDLIDGSNSLFDIIQDARDYLAWSQTDGYGGDGGEGGNTELSCSKFELDVQVGYFEAYGGGTDWTFDGWSNVTPGVTECGAGPGTFDIDYADGTTEGPFPGNCYGGAVSERSFMDTGNANTGGPFHSFPSVVGTTTYSVMGMFNGLPICSIDIDVTVADPNDVCGMNGWRYSENDSSIDNSVSQWPALALLEANERWGIDTKPAVKTELDGWLDYTQDTATDGCSTANPGSYGYSSPCSWLNYAKAGAGLIMRHFTGHTAGEAMNQLSLDYLGNDYNNSGTGGNNNKGSFYPMYAFYKGMKLYGLPTLAVPAGGPALNWEQDYTDWLVSNQEGDGSWPGMAWMDDLMATYFGVAMLAPEVAGLPPVAVAGGPYGPVNPTQDIALDGSQSFHQDPAKQIVKYEWDFDALDGLWWDTKPAPTADEGAVGVDPTHPGYPDTGGTETYSVTLRVTDNSSPAETDTDVTSVEVTTGNVPPTALSNGPWGGVPSTNAACNPADPAAVNNALCYPITFDASGSSDANAGPPLNDSIVSYEWDLDGDGAFNETNGDDGWPQDPGNVVVKKLYQNPTSGAATLRVTDSFGLQGLDSDQFVSVAFVYGTNYTNCYAARTARFVEQRGLRVEFSNIGDATAENVMMTLSGKPANVTIVKGVASLGDIDPGTMVPTPCDGTLAGSDIVIDVNLRVPPTGNWSWTADFDFNGQHYTVPNLPATAP